MESRFKMYIIENIHTGEIFKGRKREITKKIGRNVASLHSYAERDGILDGTWKVSITDEIIHIAMNGHAPTDLCKEWDKVTAMLRKKIQWVKKDAEIFQEQGNVRVLGRLRR